ncbi:biofilm master transcriptional regulator CsgD [Serratia sp. M24T3]|uniref:biofilm master transcriptional regulator CsgD n=1 Tax=Serratia sp. M24T3 TaxID=932213 RepID=UPI00025B8E4C|nr:biofilm master transcriptional regulator CsgD [Serratia sp. M24T3]EIC85164.1 DNA-binding transcriptional regulator CsgD [Serratia sp. M24T3]
MITENTDANTVMLLVTKPCLQATALLHHLNHKLTINTKLHNINRPFDAPLNDQALIIFDILQADKKLITRWQTAAGRYRNNLKILLLNAPEDYPFHEIENWPKISAVFHPSTTQEQLIDGIESVIRGECYFAQRFASYLINQSGQYRYINHEHSGITQRESEILNKLRMGASNVEIAKLLFISENTVKTHLYNLFRKIAVKNRTQAVSWANDNLKR